MLHYYHSDRKMVKIVCHMKQLKLAVILLALLFAACTKPGKGVDEGPEQPMVLAAPELTYEADVHDVRVSWESISGASGYRVSTDDRTSWSELQTELYFVHGGLEPETTYTVCVMAVGDGEAYRDSEPAAIEVTTTAEAKIPVKLESPVLTSEANVRNAMITWEHIGNASGYRVSIDGRESWNEHQTHNHFAYGGLEPETTYKVHVVAVGDGEDYSDSEPAETEFTTQKETTVTPGEFSYRAVEWPEDILPGRKFLIAYVPSADNVRVMDNKTTSSKFAGVNLAAYYDAAQDLFVSNETTDSYACTIKDAGEGYYYIENPAGAKIGWTSGTNFNLSTTGDNTEWNIVEGNDNRYSFLITNLAASTRGIVYRAGADYEQFGAYAMQNIDHAEYLEPQLYMLDKPVVVDPDPDPDPEPGDVLKWVLVTDPDKIFSGDKVLIAHTEGGVAGVMNHRLGSYTVTTSDGSYEQPEYLPRAVDMRAYYNPSRTRFAYNETTSAYAVTLTKGGGGGYYLTNPAGQYLTRWMDSSMSWEDEPGSDTDWVLWSVARGSATGTMRIGNGTRSIAWHIHTEYGVAESWPVFGNYANSNVGTTDYKEPRLYVLRSVADDGEVDGTGGDPVVETGFPAQWNMATAAVSGGKIYAATGNTEAYISVKGATGFGMAGSSERYATASGWNNSGAAWVFSVPVTAFTSSTVTVEATMQSSTSGPRRFTVLYSSDGVNYTSTNKSIYLQTGQTKSQIDFTPTVTGFPTVFHIKLEVTGNESAGGGTIASAGTCRIYGLKLMKWYK